MRLIYLSDSTVPSDKANSVHVMKMCAAFAELGVATTLLAKRGASCDDVSKYYGVSDNFLLQRYWVPEGKLGTVWYNLRCTLYLLREKRGTLIYGRSILTVYIALLLGFKNVYLELHQPAMSAVRTKLLKRIFTHRHLRRVIFITHALQSHYQETYDLEEQKTLVLPDAADPIKTDSSSPSPFPNVERLQVTYVGQLYRGKAMEILIPVAALVPNIQFNIVGGNDEMIAHWKGSVESENIVFHGHVAHGELTHYYAHSDVLIAPYSKNVAPAGSGEDIAQWMSPLKIFEYMSARKAIVASDLPVLQEVLIHNTNALLCNPDDIDSWIYAIKKLEDKNERKRLAKNAHNNFIQKYTWKKRAERVLGMIIHRKD